MTQDSDQGAGATYSSSWPSGAVAGPPAAPVAAGGAMTVAGILTAFVLFALGLVLLQCCFNEQGRRADDETRRRHGVGTAVGNGSARTRTGRGVDPELLRSLPVTVYRAAAGPKAEEAVECAVCLAELEDGEEARFLPRCGHGFHAECVDTWLVSHSTCPLCRLTVAKPDVPLPPVPSEPANYAANLPASVLLGVSDQGAVTMASARVTTPSTGTRAVLAIEIPEAAVPTPRDTAKSPGSARLSSIRRLWSFGRQGAGASSSRSCGGAGEGADVEQGISVTIGNITLADVSLPSEAAAGACFRAGRGAIQFPELSSHRYTP